ncbi:MAG: phage Gp37/Gp68 family protein, partial [Firmicutes bacterium]|nr:phage Gp37/Gp68 family protein [Bacillota bacterium]
MAKTKIEWTEYSWNPVTGCTKISPGCANCYAERFARRLAGRCGYPKDDAFRVTLHPDKIGEPLKWRQPRRIFVSSMGDLFHEQVPDEFIARIWWVMGQCAGYLDPSRYRGHTFMILTKRPERMKEWLEGWAEQETRKRWIESLGEVYDWMNGPRYWPDVLENVWLGVTAEDQVRADERIPILLQIPAAVHWISCEPLLGPIDLSGWLEFTWACPECGDMSGFVGEWCPCGKGVYVEQPRLRWVVAGGETGPGARPMHPDWVRS